MRPPEQPPKTVEDVFNKLKLLEAEEKGSAFTASIKEREPVSLQTTQTTEELKEPEKKMSRFKMERNKEKK